MVDSVGAVAEADELGLGKALSVHKLRFDSVVVVGYAMSSLLGMTSNP